MPSGSAFQAEIDLAVVAFRESGQWQVQDIALASVESLDSVERYLRRVPGDAAMAMLSVDEEFFVVVRLRGSEVELLLSDASAATDFEIARSVVDQLGLPVDDDEEAAPAGDLRLLDDLGMSAVDLGLILEDDELFPDEQLSDIATRLGFGDAFDDLAGLAPA